jgi:hypothetical protein
VAAREPSLGQSTQFDSGLLGKYAQQDSDQLEGCESAGFLACEECAPPEQRHGMLKHLFGCPRMIMLHIECRFSLFARRSRRIVSKIGPKRATGRVVRVLICSGFPRELRPDLQDRTNAEFRPQTIDRPHERRICARTRGRRGQSESPRGDRSDRPAG